MSTKNQRTELAQYVNKYVLTSCHLESFKEIDDNVTLFLFRNVLIGFANSSDELTKLDHIHLRVDDRVNPILAVVLKEKTTEKNGKSVRFICKVTQYRRNDGSYDLGVAPISDNLQNEYLDFACANKEEMSATQELVVEFARNRTRRRHITQAEYQKIQELENHFENALRLARLGLITLDTDSRKHLALNARNLPLYMKILKEEFKKRASTKRSELVRNSKGFAKV
jgi:hypothetical protein